MTGPTYPAARAAAPRIHELLIEHASEARRRDPHRDIATVPEVEAIEAIISAAFWASLRREEGFVPRISLAFLAPHETAHPMVFERPFPMLPAALTKIAPAVERVGIHLGVWPDEHNELVVWGTARSTPTTCFVLEVAAPGVLVVKHHRGTESGKYMNVAVLEGDDVKIVDERASSLPDCPPLLASLLGFDSPTSWIDTVNVLVQPSVSMRAHRRGGLLLVVPAGGETWKESIVKPIPYAISPPFSELAALWREGPAERRRPVWLESLKKSIATVAGLTAVDGATILSGDYEVLAFGAKITRRKGSPQVEQVTMTEPVEGAIASLVESTQLGGTRHLSAAQFVHDQRDTVALVASQDGHFTIFAWSPTEGMVHGHRVEALLL